MKSNTGAQVPLASVAQVSRRAIPSLSVNHQGQFPAVTLSFNLTPGVSLGDATKLIQKAAQEIAHARDDSRPVSRAPRRFSKPRSPALPLLLGAALIVVYVVLGILYESLIHPITILSTLPSAGLGALLALSC